MWRFNLKRKPSPGKTILLCPFFRSIFAVGLIVFSSTAVLNAQTTVSLRGIVLGEDNAAPVENAEITILETLFKTTSSANGQYGLDNIPPGSYDIKVSAPGYRDTTLSGIEIQSDIATVLNIVIQPRVYPLGKIIVKARRQALDPDPIKIINQKEIKDSRAANLPELLSTVEGLYVQESGSGGRAQVRIRGGQSEQVLILIDGHKINASGNGSADLNTIPLNMIESVEIYKGGASADFGPGAMAGAINIITRPTHLSDRLSFEGQRTVGKWNRNDYDLTVKNPLPVANLSTKFSFGRKSSDGNFDYEYSVSGYDTVHTGTRLNNDYRSDNYFASGIYNLSPAWDISYSGQFYHNRNGLPGRATRQNEFARAEDKRRLLTSGLRYRTNRTTIDFDLGYSEFKQDFIDTLTAQPLMQFNDHYDNDILSVKHNQTHRLSTSSILKFGAEYNRDKLEHENRLRPALSMGQSHRDYGGLYLGGEQYFDISKIVVLDRVNLNGIIRYDHSRTAKDSTSWADTVKSHGTDFLSPKIGIAISKGDITSLTVRANYGKSFRLPAINALFWVGDARSAGNPGLKPERSEHSETGIDFRTAFGILDFSAGALYYRNHTYDLIVWGVNSQGVWTPQNLPRSLITGHEEHLELSLFDENIVLRYRNSVTDAISRTTGTDGTPQHNTDGNRIALYPGYITRLTLRLDYRMFHAAYDVRLVGRVYTNLENTRYYDGYRLDDLSLGLTAGINHTWKFNADLKINNIRDVSYETMANYPMPGREWRFGIGVNLQLDKNE